MALWPCLGSTQTLPRISQRQDGVQPHRTLGRLDLEEPVGVGCGAETAGEVSSAGNGFGAGTDGTLRSDEEHQIPGSCQRSLSNVHTGRSRCQRPGTLCAMPDNRSAVSGILVEGISNLSQAGREPCRAIRSEPTRTTERCVVRSFQPRAG